MSIFGQSLVRVRAGERTDRGGNKVADWADDAVSRVLIDRVSVQPSSQTERVDEVSNVRTSRLRVLSEPGTTPDITGLDRIEYRGDTWAVTGDVAYWPDPGGMDHIEFVMTLVRGSR